MNKKDKKISKSLRDKLWIDFLKVNYSRMDKKARLDYLLKEDIFMYNGKV